MFASHSSDGSITYALPFVSPSAKSTESQRGLKDICHVSQAVVNTKNTKAEAKADLYVQ